MNSSEIQTLQKIFREQGFSIVKAEIWAQFVRHVFQLYWSATDQLLTAEKWDAFKIKRGALSTSKKKRGKVVRIPIEDAITTELGHFVDVLQLNLPLDHFLRQHHVQFEYEKPIYSLERAGRHSKTVDFMVSAKIGGKDAPNIVIEAKPLISKGDIKGRYLAEEGLGCFFSADSPYTVGPLGAMFAYTMNDPECSLRDEIHTAVGEHLPRPTSVRKISFHSKDWVTCSAHLRDHGMIPIVMVHVERIFPTVLQRSS